MRFTEKIIKNSISGVHRSTFAVPTSVRNLGSSGKKMDFKMSSDVKLRVKDELEQLYGTTFFKVRQISKVDYNYMIRQSSLKKKAIVIIKQLNATFVQL